VAPCDECGYDHESLDRGQVLRDVASLADEHRRLLTSVPAERLRDHPRPSSWSPLEYGCHVRDVLRVQSDRVALAQAEQTPRFAPMRRDERAADDRYNEQDPLVVAGEIVAAARQFAGTLRAMDGQGWLRTGIYPYPAPEERTVEWMGRHTAHELAHHLFDNRRLLGSVV
jgi:S-DNA-T family DNA segregation ATPase FtsK/SpoIIIE